MKNLLFIFLIIAAVFVFNFIISIPFLRKQEKLFFDLASSDAELQCKCMVRDPYLSAPGVAQIKDEKLIAYSILGKRYEASLSDLVVVREYYGFGKLGWIGKRVFRLRSPDSDLIALGISQSEAPLWRKAFYS